MSLKWLYSLDELRAYSLSTKEGKQRLETLLKQLPKIMEAADIQLVPRSQVLCLMAGSCIEGIAFAQLYEAHVTCLDLQRRMLAKGEREARRRKLDLRTIVADVKQLGKHVSGRFDLVTILGSPLPHINIHDFDKVVGQVLKVLARSGTFLTYQSDLVFRIMPQYRDAFVANLDPLSSASTEVSTLERATLNDFSTARRETRCSGSTCGAHGSSSTFSRRTGSPKLT